MEPAPAKTKKGAARRAAILAAARELFALHGFRATSLDDIGARAGVSGPAIYTYFKSKHDLLGVLLDDAVLLWRDTVEEILSQDAPPRATLERLVDAAVALELQNGSLRVSTKDRELVDEDVRRRLARIERLTRAEWVHVLCEVRPGLTDEEARAAILIVEGMLRSVSSLRTGIDPERVAGVTKAMTLGALLGIGEQPLTAEAAAQ